MTANAAADSTWTGATASGVGAGDWSNGTNWQGNTAPSLNAGTLTFPRLTAATCANVSPAMACDDTSDDISVLDVTGIVIDNGPVPGGLATPQLEGTGTVNLGSGGITASTSNCGTSGVVPTIGMPIVLTAPQSWSITGCLGLNLNAGLGSGVTSAAADTLGLVVTHTSLGVSSNLETGPITISGGGGVDLPSTGGGGQGRLNANDGNGVTVNGSTLVSTNGYVGPLTMTGGSFLQIGIPCCDAPTGMLTAHGDVTLDASGTVQFAIEMAGSQAGTDYSQLDALTSPHSVNLNSTKLELTGGSDTGCPTLHQGDVDTLIQASSITGTFNGVPDGAVVPVTCVSAGGAQPFVRINYTSTTVTATVTSQPAYTLTVTKAGSGSGSVTSAPSGITCGATCSATFPAGESVTLTAAPAAGSTFAGWSGSGCSGTSTCTVAMSSSKSVAASFSGTGGPGGGGAPTVRLAGSPTVTANGVKLKLTCSGAAGQTCQTTDTLTSTVTLRGGKPVAVAAAHRQHKLTVIVGRATATIAAGATKSISIALTAEGRKLLKRFGRLPVTLKITLTGKTMTIVVSKKLVLKAKKPHG